ncbi:unnamed protein product [Blepharisma stoltei]|uniref:Enoyl reductase (ER) domain-containing protein n=1 Tax=Blepharisma stoltei TaxID=1481888 RepID=A0AAU9INM8_9CILI|nr:unnamed protein product [Blepharisma stoltei]
MEAQSIRGVRVHAYNDLDSITIDQVPIPDLKDDQILVRIEYAPINIIDLMQALGYYNRQPLPHFFGKEGSGTVVKTGNHPYARFLLGKRVSVDSNVPGFGTYADYLVAYASDAYPLRDSVTFEQAASLIVNPMTVAYMVEKLKQGNHTSALINAAASGIGKMLIKWCKLLNITTVNFVRRQDQADILASIGAEHIFNTSNDGWKESAKALTTQLGTKIGFDAISGSATQDMLDLLENDGIAYIYGALSGEPAHVSPMSLIGGDKTVKGLLLTTWLARMTNEKRVEVGYQIQDLIGSALKTDYISEVTIGEVKDALKQYAAKKTDSKFVVKIRRG